MFGGFFFFSKKKKKGFCFIYRPLKKLNFSLIVLRTFLVKTVLSCSQCCTFAAIGIRGGGEGGGCVDMPTERTFSGAVINRRRASIAHAREERIE